MTDRWSNAKRMRTNDEQHMASGVATIIALLALIESDRRCLLLLWRDGAINSPGTKQSSGRGRRRSARTMPGGRECKLRYKFAMLDRVGNHDPARESAETWRGEDNQRDRIRSQARNISGISSQAPVTWPLSHWSVAWRVAVKWFPDNGTPEERKGEGGSECRQPNDGRTEEGGDERGCGQRQRKDGGVEGRRC